ncbi:MAG: hypothetical protein H6742_16645 [Alphaproteobacteria bacterium]|nr:hypothetical protein [Alphaproteobacteria bacterium]
MILLCLWLWTMAAHAGSWAGMRNTADTLDPGEVVLRLPTGRSAVGLSPSTEVFLTPFDVVMGGTRLGVEQVVVERGAVAWSLSPSIAEKWSLGRTGLRLESVVTGTRGRTSASIVVAGDVNLLRQTTLGETASQRWTVDRVHVPVAVIVDHAWRDSVVRGTARVGLLDEGRAMTWGTVVGSFLHRFGGLHFEVGAGLFVGRPSEHTFLGTYEHLLVAPYPKLDLWWQL